MLGLECYERTEQVVTTDSGAVPIIKFCYQLELFALRKIYLQSKKDVSMVYNFVFLSPPQQIFAPAFMFLAVSGRARLPSHIGRILVRRKLKSFSNILILYFFRGLCLSDLKYSEALEPLLTSFLFSLLHN